MRYSDKRPTAVFDIECYPNYFLIYFRNVETLKGKYFEAYPTLGLDLDIEGIQKIIRKYRLVSFNGNSYDVPMLTLALSGASCGELKRASDTIIQADMKAWEFYEHYECQPPKALDHIDLIEVAPGQASLKIYGGRIHSRRMQDLPFDPDDEITPEKRSKLIEYCGNDLQTTIDLWESLKAQIDLRVAISEQYDLDVRSKSDAQIAEALIKHELEAMTNRRVKRPEVRSGTFLYRPPEFMRFRSPELQEMFRRVCRAGFVVRRNGRVEMPAELENYAVRIGDGVYRMGIGGLHSSEERRTIYADDEHDLIDSDVTSYYPSMIIVNEFIPRHLGRNFLKVYEGFYRKRLAAKASGDKVVADSFKIVLNGSFGKLGSPYSILYSPDLMIQVTVTGQLSLLMLIEDLESRGIRVVSANTDGIISLVPKRLRSVYEMVIFDWECATGMGMEFTEYAAVYSANVNNYIAITKDGKAKRKGLYAPSGMSKNPSAEISTEAVVEYLTKGTPIEQTIERCEDIRKFVTIRQVRGGGMKGDQYLGKAVRWYYAEGEQSGITYKSNGNMVPKSVGAKPLMTLPDEFPDDIDYEWYAREAYAILDDLGVEFVDPYYAGRSGVKHARLPEQKNIHLVDMSNGVALCGKAPPGPRVRWIEFNRLPDGHRLCPKCRREDTL